MRSRPHRGVADLTACLIALTLALVVLTDPCVSAEHGVEMLSSGFEDAALGPSELIQLYESASICKYSVPTSAPTSVPTRVPTSVPTNAPTEHPCKSEQSHACDDVEGGVCIAEGHGYKCGCDEAYICVGSACHKAEKKAKNCVITSTPTQAPSYSPSHSPSYAPSGSPSHSPSYAPSESPSYSPTIAPTSGPTHAPTEHPCTSEQSHACDDVEGGVCIAEGYGYKCGCDEAYICVGSACHKAEKKAKNCVITSTPSQAPSDAPSDTPTKTPSWSPSHMPTHAPTDQPSTLPAAPKTRRRRRVAGAASSTARRRRRRRRRRVASTLKATTRRRRRRNNSSSARRLLSEERLTEQKHEDSAALHGEHLTGWLIDLCEHLTDSPNIKVCSLLTEPESEKLIRKVSGPLAKLDFPDHVNEIGSLNSADKCPEELIFDLEIAEFEIDSKTATFVGTLGLNNTSGEFDIIARSSQDLALNNILTMSKMHLSVSLDLHKKVIENAALLAAMHVNLFEQEVQAQGVLHISPDGGLQGEASFVMHSVQLKTLKLEALGIDLQFNNGKLSGNMQSSIELQLGEDAKPIDIEVEGPMSWTSGGWRAEVKGKMNDMISGVIPGISFISIGSLEASVLLEDDHVGTIHMNGALCLGAEADCASGTPNDRNVIGQVEIKDVDCAGGYVVFAKLAAVDLQRIITIVASADESSTLPESIASLVLKPLQEDCGSKSKLSDCYFVVAFTPGDVELNTLSPPLRLKAGLSLVGQVKLLGEPFVTLFHHPIAGTHETSEWSMGLSAGALAVHQPLDLARHKPVINVIKNLPKIGCKKCKKGCKECESPAISVDMDFVQALKFATSAFCEAVPSSKDVVELAVRNVILGPVRKLNKVLLSAGMTSWLSVTVKSSFGQFPFFVVTGTHGSGSSIVVQLTPDGAMAAMSVTAPLMSALCTNLFGSDPFKSIPLLSNLKIAALVSSTQMDFLAGAALAAPFDAVTGVPGAGVCVEALVGGVDRAVCAGDTLCQLFNPGHGKKSMGGKEEASLSLKGCMTSEVNEFFIGLGLIYINKNTQLVDAGLIFKQHLKSVPPMTEYGVTAGLRLFLGDDRTDQAHWVTFRGTITGTTGGKTGSALKLSFAQEGMWKSSFGITGLNLYDLIIEATLIPAPPFLAGFVLGGGVCIGPYSKCVKHKEGQAQQGIIAAKAYVGSDPPFIFFYASIAKNSLGGIVTAIAPKAKASLPDWLSEIGFEGFDREACAKGNARACEAVISYCSDPLGKVLTQVVPPLKIPAGFHMAGTLNLFDAWMSFRLKHAPDHLLVELNSSPITIASVITIRKSEAEQSKGPKMKLTIGTVDVPMFEFLLQGYTNLQLGRYSLGKGTVYVKVTKTVYEFRAPEFSFFNGAIDGSYVLKMGILPPSYHLAITLDTTELSRSVSDVAGASLKIISDIKKSANDALNKAMKKLEEAQAKVRGAENAVNSAQTKCDAAGEKLRSKKAYCKKAFGKERRLGEPAASAHGRKLLFGGRRRRRWFKAIKKAVTKVAKAVVTVVKKGASVLCNEAVDALASLVTAACKAPMQLVTQALKGVQAVLRAAQNVLRGVQTLINLALNGLTSLLTLLTRFSLQKVSFSVSASSTIEIKGSVEIVKDGKIDISTGPDDKNKRCNSGQSDSCVPITRVPIDCSYKCPSHIRDTRGLVWVPVVSPVGQRPHLDQKHAGSLEDDISNIFKPKAELKRGKCNIFMFVQNELVEMDKGAIENELGEVLDGASEVLDGVGQLSPVDFHCEKTGVADPMVFDFALKVNTKDLPAMALELFKSVFEPLVKQAFDLAKRKIKEALGMNEELERMEAQWELKQMEMLQQKALQDQKIAKAEERVRLAEFRLEEQMRKEAEEAEESRV